MAVSSVEEIGPLQNVRTRLQALLRNAQDLKPRGSIVTPLPTSELLDEVNALHDDFNKDYDESYRSATVEQAIREIFYSLVKVTEIGDSAFVEVWNLLDITLVCGDQGKCLHTLQSLLIEELFDSLTTDGSKIAFDFVESRRQTLVQKDFQSKSQIILRFCNELLRRLSRAEDAIFCGRVFLFLFQMFPLGDRSSVNLRGYFHTENTTKFEVPEIRTQPNGDSMEVDQELVKAETATPKAGTPQPTTKPGGKAIPVKAPPKKSEQEKVISNDELYPIFWRLQQDFSDPRQLLVGERLQAFKRGLADTITKFKNTPTVVQTKAAESSQRGTKRKFGKDESIGENGDGESSDQFVGNYNPKYLTSRDLFDLELSDLAFQRHILVQALILIDLLLSVTEKAKQKVLSIGSVTNPKIIEDMTLSEEDAKWALGTRATITTYLSGTQEGKLFNRMVDTVLARDKNWVRWKLEYCRRIVRDPVSSESEFEARKGVKEATRIRRIPEKPPGSMDLSFLDEGGRGGLEALKDPARYATPSIDQLIDGITNDELDLDMAMDDDETNNLRNAMSNKRWRVLRQARATRLGLLDQVEPGKDLDTIFRPAPEVDVDEEMAAEQADDDHAVADAEPDSARDDPASSGIPVVSIDTGPGEVQTMEQLESDMNVEESTAVT